METGNHYIAQPYQYQLKSFDVIERQQIQERVDKTLGTSINSNLMSPLIA